MIGLRLAHSVVINEIPEKTPTFEEYLKLGWSKGMASAFVYENALFDAKKILEKYQVTKLLKFCGLCVHEDYRNKGIGSELVKRAINHGSSKGYTLIGVVGSSFYSQRIFERQGFQKVKSIPYADFLINGEVVFTGIEDIHKFCCSYIKQIKINDVE